MRVKVTLESETVWVSVPKKPVKIYVYIKQLLKLFSLSDSDYNLTMDNVIIPLCENTNILELGDHLTLKANSVLPAASLSVEVSSPSVSFQASLSPGPAASPSCGGPSSHSNSVADADDAVAANYAVRIDKNKGMTVTQQNGSENGRYDSSSESTSTAPDNIKRPNIDAPAPAKGILKKVASNPSLAKLDGMSEVSGAVSEVGYITNKLTKRLQARGQRDILDPIDSLDIVKQRLESSTEDIRLQERDNWSRQKEELKAWAQSQGNENSVEQSHSKQKQQQNNSQTPEIRSTEPQPILTNDPSETTFWVTPPMVPQDLHWIYNLQSTSVNTDYEPGARNPVYNYEKKEECDNDVMDLDELKNPKRMKLDILQEAMLVNDINPEEEEVKKYQCEGCSMRYKHRAQRQRCRQRCGVK